MLDMIHELGLEKTIHSRGLFFILLLLLFLFSFFPPLSPCLFSSHLSLFSLHFLVGDDEKRGISGGEKKRLSIGCEMIADPRFLFLSLFFPSFLFSNHLILTTTTTNNTVSSFWMSPPQDWMVPFPSLPFPSHLLPPPLLPYFPPPLTAFFLPLSSPTSLQLSTSRPYPQKIGHRWENCYLYSPSTSFFYFCHVIIFLFLFLFSFFFFLLLLLFFLSLSLPSLSHPPPPGSTTFVVSLKAESFISAPEMELSLILSQKS